MTACAALEGAGMTVCVTGGIGSGKSLAAGMIVDEYGFFLLDSDSIALGMEEPGEKVYEALVSEFGSGMLSGVNIDKSKLSDLIYSSRAAQERVNAIVHPFVIDYIDDFVRTHAGENIVIETALPWKGLRAICDLIVYVRSKKEIRIGRLVGERGMDASLAERIMGMQPSDSEYLSLADIVIENDCGEESLLDKLKEIFG